MEKIVGRILNNLQKVTDDATELSQLHLSAALIQRAEYFAQRAELLREEIESVYEW